MWKDLWEVTLDIKRENKTKGGKNPRTKLGVEARDTKIKQFEMVKIISARSKHILSP